MKLLLSTLAACLCLSSAARAQPSAAEKEKDWPTQPIHFVVAFPPGGAADNLARMLGIEFSRELGVPVIIDNKPGASAAIGSSYTIGAPPDGYTIMMSGFAPLITNRFTQKKMTYDPDAFTRVALLSATPNVLVANPSMPFKTVPELVTYAKAHPGELTFASFGIGTTSHLAGEMLKNAAHIDMLHIPFKGANQAIPALLGGQVSLYFDAIPATMPLIKQGKLRAIAVTSATRLAALPDVPTIAETYPGYEMNPWNGIVAPPHTPPAIVQKLNTAINKVLADPRIKARLAEIGTEPVIGSVADFEAKLKREIPRIQALVKSAGIEPE
jgi:tripartite-type tricarboxylate transporter receptor subunit TctC